MRLNDKLREQSELLPSSVFALSIQCVVASVIVLPPCVVTLPTDISVPYVLVKERESHF